MITPKKIGRKIEKLFLAQNCLKRIMSELLDYTKKNDKISKKNRKIIFGSDWSNQITPKNDKKTRNKIETSLAQICLKQIMSQLFDYPKKLTKNREKKLKNHLGSHLSEMNNEPTF